MFSLPALAITVSLMEAELDGAASASFVEEFDFCFFWLRSSAEKMERITIKTKVIEPNL